MRERSNEVVRPGGFSLSTHAPCLSSVRTMHIKGAFSADLVQLVEPGFVIRKMLVRPRQSAPVRGCGLMVRTAAFHAVNPGSIPGIPTNRV
jgi:hypothetical protein